MLGERISETLNSINLADLVQTCRKKAENNIMSYI
jgi:hypothetical protein